MRFVIQRWTFLAATIVASLFATVVSAQPTTLPTVSTTQPAARKTVKLLTIGNSFAGNATRYLNAIATAAGNKLVIGLANNSGLSLEQHWRAVEAFEANPTDPAGLLYPTGPNQPKTSLSALLAKDQWDYITIQQASYWSDKPSSYHPYAQKLHDYIKARAPQAEIVIHQTWAYRADHPNFKDGKSDWRTMYTGLRDAYTALSQQLTLRVIPVGDAMYAAVNNAERLYQPDKTFDFAKAVYPAVPVELNSFHTGWTWRNNKKGVRQLQLDGAHASIMGCYLGSCVFYEFLFEEDVIGNPFLPPGMKPEDTAFVQKIAHATMLTSRGPSNSISNTDPVAAPAVVSPTAHEPNPAPVAR